MPALPEPDSNTPPQAWGLRLREALRWRLPGGQCAVCRQWNTTPICHDCHQRFDRPCVRCKRCAIALEGGGELCGACLSEPAGFDAAVAAWDYDYPWARLITEFKFGSQVWWAEYLATELAARAKAHDRPDRVVCAPLSERGLRERGYNQAWELARRCAATLGLTAMPSALIKLRHTPPQAELPFKERAANLRGAFVVEPGAQPEIRDRHIAVVDDVMTTGATARELALTLKSAGAARVSIWVLARTPRNSGTGQR